MTIDAQQAPELRFDTRPSANGASIGVIRLARPSRVNALTVPMCEAMLDRLGEWSSDESIACVVVEGEGDKGFSSGGDVVSGVRAIRTGGPARYVYADRLFGAEYRLVQAIFEFDKPVVSFAHGVTMGAGLGLAVAASHRIVARGARIAMPESRIGLFPDVGAAWFLGRAPGNAGPLIAMSGIVLDADDATFCGLFDWIAPNATTEAMHGALVATSFSGNARHDRERVAAALTGSFPSVAAQGPLRQRYDALAKIGRERSVTGVREAVAAAAAHDAWFSDVLAGLDAGSPTSLSVGFEHFRRMRGRSLAEALATDLVLARAFVRGHEFPEGVRAALIDKDRQPDWQPPRLSDVTRELVDGHFAR